MSFKKELLLIIVPLMDSNLVPAPANHSCRGLSVRSWCAFSKMLLLYPSDPYSFFFLTSLLLAGLKLELRHLFSQVLFLGEGFQSSYWENYSSLVVSILSSNFSRTHSFGKEFKTTSADKMCSPFPSINFLGGLLELEMLGKYWLEH